MRLCKCAKRALAKKIKNPEGGFFFILSCLSSVSALEYVVGRKVITCGVKVVLFLVRPPKLLRGTWLSVRM